MPKGVTGSTASAKAEAVDTSRMKILQQKIKDPFFWSDWLVVVAFVVVIAFFGAIAPESFLTLYNLNNILVAASIPAIIVVGQTFTVATAGIDLSVSSTMTLGAVVFGLAFTNGWPIWQCAIFATVAGLLVGFLNGFIIAKRKINDFIVTLGMLSVAAGAALVLSDGRPRQIVSEPLATLAIGDVANVPYLMFIALGIVLIAHFVLFNTRFGTHVLATGGDPDAARAMGISIVKIKIAVYSISGALAGFAAMLTISRIGAAEPAANTAILLNSVAAVVLGGVSLFGGRGTILGPFVATLLLQSLTNGLTVIGVAAYYQYLSIGLVVILSAALVRTNK
jgi:ribose/xylose/arabinose/galactoside ABC-type transport system permease subunit